MSNDKVAATFHGCSCIPCPGRGNDGHGMTHCAECCFGSRIVADIDCPIHGLDDLPPDMRVCPTCTDLAHVLEEHEEQAGYEEKARPIWVIDLSCGHHIETDLPRNRSTT